MQFVVLNVAIMLVVNVTDCVGQYRGVDGWTHNANESLTPAECVARYPQLLFTPTPKTIFFYSMQLTVMRSVTFMTGKCVGGLSDRCGRRPLMLFAAAGCESKWPPPSRPVAGADNTHHCCAPPDVATGLLYLVGYLTWTYGLFVAGAVVLGSSAPMNPHASNYCSDVSAPSRLGRNMVRLQATGSSWGLSFGFLCSLTLVVTAALTDPFSSPTLCFAAGTAIGFVGTVALCLWLPESLLERRRGAEPLLSLTPLSLVWLCGRSRYLACLVHTVFWYSFQIAAAESVVASYCILRYDLQRDPGTLLVSLVGLIMMVFLAQGCAGVAFGDAFLRRLGFKGCIHAAFVAGGLLGPAVFAAAPVASALKTFDWRTMLLDGLLWVVCAVFGSVGVPLMIALFYAQADAEERGSFGGSYRTVEGLGRATGSLVMGQWFMPQFVQGGGMSGAQWAGLPVVLCWTCASAVAYASFCLGERLYAHQDTRRWAEEGAVAAV